MPAPEAQVESARSEEAREALRIAIARARARSAEYGEKLDSAIHEELAGRSGLGSFVQGFQSTGSQGFSDDWERMTASTDSMSNLRNRVSTATGEPVALNHLSALAEHPNLYKAGQGVGAFATGFATRFIPQGIGGARQVVADRNLGNNLRLANERMARGIDAGSPAAARAVTDAQRALQQATQRNALISQGGLKTNRAQAQVYDAAHGAAMGYGGLDPTKNEDAFSLERLQRGAIGGGLGYAFAPVAAGTMTNVNAAGRYVGQQMGLAPNTPLRQRQLNMPPDRAVAQAANADEMAARETARRAGTALPERGDVTIYPNRAQDGGPSVRALRAAAETPSRRVRGLGRMVDRADLGRFEQRITEMARLGARPEDVDFVAQQMAQRGRREAGEAVVNQIDQIAGRTPTGRRGANDADVRKAANDPRVRALLDSFDRRDIPAQASWVRSVQGAGAFHATPGARGALQVAMGQRLKDTYNRGGTDALLATLRDPELAPYWNAVGFGRLADDIDAGVTQSPWTIAAERVRQAAVRDDDRAQLPRMQARPDRRFDRFEVNPRDADRLRGEFAANNRLPMDPANPANVSADRIFDLNRASFRDYMAEGMRATRARLGGAEDFDPADVTWGGAFATTFAAAVEQYGIGPGIAYLYEQGMGEPDIMRIVQALQQQQEQPPPDQGATQ